MFVSIMPFIYLEKWEGGISDATQEMLLQILNTRYYVCADGDAHKFKTLLVTKC